MTMNEMHGFPVSLLTLAFIQLWNITQNTTSYYLQLDKQNDLYINELNTLHLT